MQRSPSTLPLKKRRTGIYEEEEENISQKSPPSSTKKRNYERAFKKALLNGTFVEIDSDDSGNEDFGKSAKRLSLANDRILRTSNRNSITASKKVNDSDDEIKEIKKSTRRLSLAKTKRKETDISDDEVVEIKKSRRLSLAKEKLRSSKQNYSSDSSDEIEEIKRSSRRLSIVKSRPSRNSFINNNKNYKETDESDDDVVEVRKSRRLSVKNSEQVTKKTNDSKKINETRRSYRKKSAEPETPKSKKKSLEPETPKSRNQSIEPETPRLKKIIVESVTPKTRKKSVEPETPKTRKKSFEAETPKLRKTSIEPVTPTTRRESKELPRTPLEKARQSLHVSTVPESLPCREKEFKNVLNFLENKLLDGIGGCMYISGVPGTGKTATVTQVIRHLKNLSKEGTVPEFKFIELNGMRLADPRQAYTMLWQKLFNKKEKLAPDRAQRLLDSWFSKNDKGNEKLTTVLLIDELDLICTKKQDVVYNLLDWPTRTHSRLVVLTIANTMDMPERIFKGRVTSRLGLTRLTFLPYTHKQLEEIVMARLNGLNAFVVDAVRLVSRKVAAVSGDARRALDICRRATELPAPDETVKISHIEEAIKEMTNSNIVKVIRNCCEMEKLFLRSISDVSVRSGLDEVEFRDVIDHLLTLCILEGFPKPPISAIITLSNRLKCFRLIYTNQSQAGILQKLTLNVTQDDIHYALKAS